MARTVQSQMSYDLLCAELARRGYTFDTYNLGYLYTRFMPPVGRSWLTRNGILSYPFITGTAKVICRDKLLSQKLVASQGVPVIPTLEYPCDAAAMLTFLQENAPLVVKPKDSGGSRGLSLNVTDTVDLQAAITVASEYSKHVLLQRQFTGQEVRVTLFDGKVLSAILRQSPRVVGDGASTIAELIVKENEERQRLVFEYLTYPQLTADLIAAEHLTDNRVPANDEIVELSQTTLVSRGASLYDITDTLHGSYKAIAESLNGVLNPDFLIVDLLVQDYEQPATDESYVFLEFTTSPALKMYSIMRDGKHVDIVSLLADKIDAYCMPGK